MTRFSLTALAALLAATAPVAAQEAPRFRYGEIAAPLQPGAVMLPTAPKGVQDREQWMTQNGSIGVRNVSHATLTPVLPAGPSTGAAVIVAPGGGFLGLSMDAEGWQVARWPITASPPSSSNIAYSPHRATMWSGRKSSTA